MRTLINILIAASLFFLSFQLSAQPYFHPGSTLLVGTESLNVRESDDIDAQVQDQLTFGQEVLILSMSENYFSSNDRSYPFVEIRYQKEGEEKRGFVWAGLLAVDHVYEGNTLYLLKHSKGGDLTDLSAIFELYKWEEGVLNKLHQISYEGLELDLLEHISLHILQAKGLENVERVFQINISHLACCSSEDQLYFLEHSKQELFPLAPINNIFCDGELPRFEYHFPEDQIGEKATILLTETEYDLEGNVHNRKFVKRISWVDGEVALRTK
ncbi:MAG: hypothetical protein AAF696_03505 [Bacteroidota bacterium]